jgi:hypothetical protein
MYIYIPKTNVGWGNRGERERRERPGEKKRIQMWVKAE